MSENSQAIFDKAVLEYTAGVEQAKADFIVLLLLAPEAKDCGYRAWTHFDRTQGRYEAVLEKSLPPFSIKWKGDPYYVTYHPIGKELL